MIGGGAQFQKKKFTTGGDGLDMKPHRVMTDIDKNRMREEARSIDKFVTGIAKAKAKKQIVPYGNRILCKRRKVGGKLGSGVLVSAEITDSQLTEIAEVVFVPELTLADKALVDNAEKIMGGLASKAMEGDARAVEALMTFKDYLHVKSIHVGDVIFIGKYVGTNFDIGETGESLCLVDGHDVRGMVIEVKDE